MEKNMDVEKEFVVLQGCCTHLAKMVSKDLDRFSTNQHDKIYEAANTRKHGAGNHSEK